MTKPTITKTWIGGLAVFGAGIVAALVGVFLMLAYGGTFTQVQGTASQYDFTPNNNGMFWFSISIITIGGLIAAAGSIAQFAAWVGTLFNTYLMPTKEWFFVLLIGGLLSFFFAPLGFGAMLAYVIAGPDGTAYRAAHAPAPAPAPSALAPTA